MAETAGKQSITISGDIGSGKSTVARGLTEALGWKLEATGSLQRALALEFGIDTLVLNRRAESDPNLDAAIDNTLRALAGSPDCRVVESRMAFFFLKDAFHVYLYCDTEAAAKRIFRAGRATEKYENVEAAIEGIQRRRASEIRRFRTLYGVDIDDLRNYDCVVDTSFATVQEIVDLLRGSARDFSFLAPCFLCPQSLFATPDDGDVSPHSEKSDAVIVAFGNRKFRIVSGHNKVRAARLSGQTWVSAALVSDAKPRQ